MSDDRKILEEIVGKEVINKDGKKVDTAPFFRPGKIIMVYYSASWCMPCQSFTPRLKQFYEKYHDEKNFEIVFISSDEGEENIKEYFFDNMPWHMVPIERISEAEKASECYPISGIPTLMVFDGESGKLLTKKGKVGVWKNDLDGFPWKEDQQ